MQIEASHRARVAFWGVCLVTVLAAIALLAGCSSKSDKSAKASAPPSLAPDASSDERPSRTACLLYADCKKAAKEGCCWCWSTAFGGILQRARGDVPKRRTSR